METDTLEQRDQGVGLLTSIICPSSRLPPGGGAIWLVGNTRRLAYVVPAWNTSECLIIRGGKNTSEVPTKLGKTAGRALVLARAGLTARGRPRERAAAARAWPLRAAVATPAFRRRFGRAASAPAALGGAAVGPQDTRWPVAAAAGTMVP